MNSLTQTESYIVLKPIAERFSRIANSITDDEIKALIRSCLRDQVNRVNLGDTVSFIVNEWIENNGDKIQGYAQEAIKKKFVTL